ncbi:hypothetical protein GQ55_6G106600 [Panicum hallii var. hallii]|uniref:DUF4371 domain-containing protein n=1 Tax=Panicum hallii var. hallii TaxID=1504633 RepID=A0A2T7D5M5_9POAL|nr:hypothetical protein GQ55_6G106600 [Panicum hallii var. hallii]
MPVNESESSGNESDDYSIEHDPGLRVPISSYPVSDQDLVRRAFIALGPCRPNMKRDNFPQHDCGGMRRFQPKWFDEFKCLEYSVHKDAAYFFIYYLFKDSSKFPGGNAFFEEGRPCTSIHESCASNTIEFKARYLARLTWSLKCIRYLLHQGLAFRGNFEEVNRVVLGNAPLNCQMVDHKIEKQLIASCAHETTKFIIEELGDECFAILADESSDAYHQEQLALCLRYVNKKGETVERFLVPSAYYVHCFAHQLQLTLVAVAKENIDYQWFFGQLAYLLNVLEMSCKKIHMLHIAQAEYMIEALKFGEIESGQGLNQEMGLARPVFNSFEFIFLLHLMNEIFGYRNDLFNAMQKREQDTVNPMDVLEFTKVELDVLRQDARWEEFLKTVISFCEKHKVKVVDMDGKYIPIQRSPKFYRGATNYHRFHANMFLGVIDSQLQELNSRFDEVKTELLRCMASFSPANSFSAFNVEKLDKLAEFYPHDFFSMMLVKTNKIVWYDIVYKLLKLVLFLLVAIAGVKRIFFPMNTTKNKLRSKMGQKFLNNCLVPFIEREFFLQAKDEDIIKYFQAMKD